MENKKEEIKTNERILRKVLTGEGSSNLPEILFFGAIIVAVFMIVFFIVEGMSNNSSGVQPQPPTPTKPEQTATIPQSKSTFSQISQTDQARMKEIFTGVMQNTIPVTQDIKNELRSIFAKYNTTEAEINDFAIYGPAFAANYQRLFYTDALQAVSAGYPIKSSERLALEKEALSRGLMTSERFAINDKTMNQIANHQPIASSDGRQVIFTANSINSALNNIDSITARLKSLLE